MAEPKFIHLRVHTAYSLSEGAMKVPALMHKLKEQGVPAVALTDTANMFGGKAFSKYAADEVTAPKRMLTTTVAVEGGLLPLLPVVSSTVLPKEKVLACAAYLRGIKVQAPIAAGDVVVKDILGLGVDIVASRGM